ncbi:MAG TPA: hypothetical protein VNC61_02260 [Acidimicrobiales bacterium]|nr:hypothetical protein [Acidimicrobiales bacterium]
MTRTCNAATSRTGNFTGIVCVNAPGTGTYTRYSPVPTGTVATAGTGAIEISGKTTWIGASGS